MGFFRKPSAAEYAVGAGDLGALGTKEGLGNCPSSAVPFIIQCLVTATATTESIIPVGAGGFDFRVIDAWAYPTTAAAANEDWDVRTAAGNAGGSVIVSLQMNSIADGGRGAASTAGAVGQGGSLMVDRTAVDADGADGVFIDKVSGNDGVGTLYLLCIRV